MALLHVDCGHSDDMDDALKKKKLAKIVKKASAVEQAEQPRKRKVAATVSEQPSEVVPQKRKASGDGSKQTKSPKATKAADAADSGSAKKAKASVPADVPAAESAAKKRKLSAGGKAVANPSSAAASSTAAPLTPAPATAVSAVAGSTGKGSRIDREQVGKAIAALTTHLQRERAAAAGGGGKKGLLDDEDDAIYVTLTTKMMPKGVSKAKLDKPVRLSLPNPIAKLDDVEVHDSTACQRHPVSLSCSFCLYVVAFMR